MEDMLLIMLISALQSNESHQHGPWTRKPPRRMSCLLSSAANPDVPLMGFKGDNGGLNKIHPAVRRCGERPLRLDI